MIGHRKIALILTVGIIFTIFLPLWPVEQHNTELVELHKINPNDQSVTTFMIADQCIQGLGGYAVIGPDGVSCYVETPNGIIKRESLWEIYGPMRGGF